MKRRLAVFSPLPPVQSGIAVHNAGLLPALANHFDITSYVDDGDFARVRAVPGVEIRPASSYDRRSHELAVFHMGNHGPFHDFVYRALEEHAGLTVLHDARMTDFFGWLKQREPNRIDLSPTRTDDSRRRLSLPIEDIPSLEPIIERSRAVLVHSNVMARRIRAVFPAANVSVTRLAVPYVNTTSTSTVADSFGWPAEALVIGSVGGISRPKGIHRVVSIVSGMRRAGLDVRLVIAGWVFDPEYLADIERQVIEDGLLDAVMILTDTSDAELAAVYRMIDVVVDLRDRMSGASSLSIMTALSHRRLTVAPALDEFLEIGDPLLRLVSTTARTGIPECISLLTEFVGMKSRNGLPTHGAPAEFCRVNTELAVSTLESAIQQCMDLEDPARCTITVGEVRHKIERLPRLVLVSDLTSSTGLMQYSRALADVLDKAGVPLDYQHLPIPGAPTDPRRDISRLAERLPARRTADIELWLCSINEFNYYDEATIRPPGTDRYIIGSWFWEMPTVRSPFIEQFRHVNELWVGSPFIAQTFRNYTNVPITVVPMPIATLPDDSVNRASFGIPDDAIVYFFDFDANSHAARKNPLGLINAFSRAFDTDSRDQYGRRPVLVMKARQLDNPYHKNLDKELRAAVSTVGGFMIEDELERRTMDSLIASCDVYVSMHRAEGLGLGMLEAMHLGKPVISPAYPRKWLFPASALGLNVSSPPRLINEEDQRLFPEAGFVYSVGQMWTEPSIERTSELMRRLFDEPKLRERVGARGARLVRHYYSIRNSLDAMLERLNTIAEHRPTSRVS